MVLDFSLYYTPQKWKLNINVYVYNYVCVNYIKIISFSKIARLPIVNRKFTTVSRASGLEIDRKRINYNTVKQPHSIHFNNECSLAAITSINEKPLQQPSMSVI